MKTTKARPPFIFLGMLLSIALGGCSQFYSSFSTKPPLTPAEFKALEYSYTNQPVICSNINALKDPKEQARQRNQVLSAELQICDYKYAKFRDHVYIRDAGLNTIGDIASLGLSGAATIVGGGTGQILSGADTATKGAQSKISERWLASKTIPILISKMDGDRAAVLAVLTTNMHKSYSDFSMEEGFKQISDYNGKGSIINAIAGLQASTGTQQQQNENNVKAAQSESNKF